MVFLLIFGDFNMGYLLNDNYKVIYNNRGVITGIYDLHQNKSCFEYLEIGSECGDWHGYFSQKKIGSLKSKIISFNCDKYNFKINYEIHLNQGKLSLEQTVKLIGNKIVQTNKFLLLKDSYIGDLVSRIKLKSKNSIITVNKGKLILPKNKSIYYKLNPKFPINVENNIPLNIKFFAPYEDHYLKNASYYKSLSRDQIEYIFHNRLRVIKGNEMFIKFAKWWYNKPAPSWFTNLVLKIKPLSDFLLYIREEKISNFPFQNVVNKLYRKGQLFELRTEIIMG